MNTSENWVSHFTQNAKNHRVDWSLRPKLTTSQKNQILKSLQAWQLGETSDGAHLLAASKKYAFKINDFIYPISVELFIREEQKHGNNLGKYLDLIDEKRIEKDWGDTLFRKIRYFNTSMELWTLAVITVESSAQLFYQSLHDSSDCKLLRQICEDILIDEAFHIEFQTERMHTIFQLTPNWLKPIRFEIYRCFYFVTSSLVWFGHQKVLKQGTPTFGSFLKAMSVKFNENFGRVKQPVSKGQPEFHISNLQAIETSYF
ncbi:ferritin-like domain-containing protein [Flavobacterium silvaticum]|uniref:Ferritin-like domain-containing protein n=1 Tax=Flavobacterium silvaticum TaxID=1852020 RepID=A0A972FVD2_9FLAO|nr:ferritin-like domain-containing protein [Flavobacterium silvaticum]NMH29393.1 ferritin-like domain-containing protein [Flavobacterium silvaticum]